MGLGCGVGGGVLGVVVGLRGVVFPLVGGGHWGPSGRKGLTTKVGKAPQAKREAKAIGEVNCGALRGVTVFYLVGEGWRGYVYASNMASTG